MSTAQPSRRRPGPQVEIVRGPKGEPGEDGFLDPAALALAPDLLLATVTDTDATLGVPTEGTLLWPDGATGAYSATVDSHGVESYEVTYVVAGETTRTFTQPAVTRDAAGIVTSRPQIVES